MNACYVSGLFPINRMARGGYKHLNSCRLFPVSWTSNDKKINNKKNNKKMIINKK